MTVLSRAYLARNPFSTVFGRAQADVLECLNCPIVNDVLLVDALLLVAPEVVGG
jgi:hypothetical protein